MISKAVQNFVDTLKAKRKKTDVDRKKIELIKEATRLQIKLLKASLTIPKLTILIEDKKLEKYNEELDAEIKISEQIEKLKFRDRLEDVLKERALFKKKSIRDRFTKKSKFGFEGFITETSISQTNGLDSKSATQYVRRIQNTKDTIYTTIKARLRKEGGLKAVMKFEVRFKRKRDVLLDGVMTNVTQYTDDNARNNPFFYSDMVTFLSRDTKREIHNHINNMAMVCQVKIEAFINNGSDWVVDKIVDMSITTNAYEPVRGGCWLALPECYSSKSCVNVKNFNQTTGEQYNDCFEISILARLHPAKRDHYLYSHYKKFKGELDMTGLSLPVKIEKSSLKRFEENNNLQLNIYEAKTRTKIMNDGEKKELVNPLPLYISEKELPEDRQVDLLYIENQKEQSQSHFALIRHFNAMMSTMTGDKAAKFVCKRCMTNFTQEGLLKDHHANRVCLDHEGIKTVLPKNGENIFEFKNYKRQQQNPFRIYADFESNMEEVLQMNTLGKTTKQTIHQNVSFGCLLKSTYDEYSLPYESKRRTPEDSEEEWSAKFLDKLDQYADYVFKLLVKNEKIRMSPEQKVSHLTATHCHICERIFVLDKEGVSDKVEDHDHLNGEYRGPAHNSCNLNYNHKNYKIPVIFHNLKGYDSHFIIQAITREAYKRKVSVIAQNSEKFMCMTIGRFRFIDSYAFLTASLDTLVKSVGSDISLFPNTKMNFSGIPEKNLSLLIKKGIYPYEYMDSLYRFEETSLPTQEKFYSNLSQKSVDDEEYLHAQNVWKTFGCKNIGDYHDLYLKTDVLLLADVFENFISLCLREYKLDPTHYVSLPSFSLDAGLKFTGVKLELYYEGQEDMYAMMEKGIRGGISVISHRYAEANNKYMKNYDQSKDSSYLLYLDANNLYGYAMKGYLPTGGHTWEKPAEWYPERILQIQPDAPRGAIFEVDIDYPERLHDAHSDYPFLVEKRAVRWDELSDTQHGMITENEFVADSEKLIPNLSDKKKYVVHYRTLQQALKNGLVLKKIHRVLTFKQSNWIEKYIDHNTNLRSKAKTDFEKDFFKLLNNAFYGKMLENVRGRIDFKIVTNKKTAGKYIKRPTFKRSTIISDEVVGIELRKQTVTLDKPIFCGFTVLELSKELMYDFHYNTIKKKYGSRATLLMTDTDSLVYKIDTEDVYKDMEEMSDVFDTSDYPKDHPLYSTKNKKVAGKFKDESNGLIITSFVGLRSKMYSYNMDRPELDLDKKGGVNKHQKLKGVPRAVVSNSIDHELYKKCLMESDFKHSVTFYSLRSQNHQVYTQKQSKTGLSAFDDKRYILEDGITTRAHGHWRNNIILL
jgi:hypothetical protein